MIECCDRRKGATPIYVCTAKHIAKRAANTNTQTINADVGVCVYNK
jgi:hypothetical protein